MSKMVWHKLWSKKGSIVKLAVWLPTTKSQESTRPRCVQVECDTPLESSWRELQVWFRLHPNRRFELGVMSFQSLRSPNRDNFETPPWESWDKKSFGCRCRGQTQRILYGGRWCLPSSPGRDESSWRGPKSRGEPTWGFTDVKLRKVAT
jgi:hypothetical protein